MNRTRGTTAPAECASRYEDDGGDSAPDLVVQSPSVSDASLTPRQSFTLRATVRNQGDVRSAATNLRYYRSSDSRITTSDTYRGFDLIGALSASGTSAESISLTAPSSAGTYYYGACVDRVSGESDTGNNCSSGVRVTVRAAGNSAPDLVVQSPSVSDASLTPRQSFTLRATVRNQGGVRSAATNLRYYRSSDSRITTSDSFMGLDSIGALSASGTRAESISLTAPSTAGTYYYGACVDRVPGESDTGNNCSSGVRVTVRAAGDSAPDLVVQSPSVSDASLTPRQSFTLRATVRNQGGVRSAATNLRYYRSSDSRITTSDSFMGLDSIGALSASGTRAESIRPDRAVDGGDVLLRRLRRPSARRIGHREQLLERSADRCRWGDFGSGPGRRVSTFDGEFRGAGGRLHFRCYGAQRRRWPVGRHDFALLPIAKRHDQLWRHRGRHGRRRRSLGLGHVQGVDRPASAFDGGDVLLRRLRRPGVRGIRHGEQLFQRRACRGRQRRHRIRI